LGGWGAHWGGYTKQKGVTTAKIGPRKKKICVIPKQTTGGGKIPNKARISREEGGSNRWFEKKIVGWVGKTTLFTKKRKKGKLGKRTTEK